VVNSWDDERRGGEGQYEFGKKVVEHYLNGKPL